MKEKVSIVVFSSLRKKKKKVLKNGKLFCKNNDFVFL